jgi:hypothetical protein
MAEAGRLEREDRLVAGHGRKYDRATAQGAAALGHAAARVRERSDELFGTGVGPERRA